VKILCGAWNVELFRILEGFPDLAHDDKGPFLGGLLEGASSGFPASIGCSTAPLFWLGDDRSRHLQ
jgi:hypothetical protein